MDTIQPSLGGPGKVHGLATTFMYLELKRTKVGKSLVNWTKVVLVTK